MHISLSVIFLLSVLFLPWWVSVFLAILLLSSYKSRLVILCGGLLMDTLYGAPIVSLFSISYLYTTLFLVLILTSMFLRTKLMN